MPNKKERRKHRQGPSSWYCYAIQYLQVPWLPQGFSSQPVGCSHVSPVQPLKQVHSHITVQLAKTVRLDAPLPQQPLDALA